MAASLWERLEAALVGVGVVLLGIYIQPVQQLINSLAAPLGVTPADMVLASFVLIAAGGIPPVISAVRKRGETVEGEKPERILQHYREINERVFKKWVQQTSPMSTLWVMDGGWGSLAARQSPVPIFYRVPNSSEDPEWIVRAMRHLEARRYKKLMKVIRQIVALEEKYNIEKAEWFDRITFDVKALTTKYPILNPGDSYNEEMIMATILEISYPEVKGEKIGAKVRMRGETLASIKDPTIRNLVLGEIRILVSKYNPRKVGWDMERLLEDRNKFLKKVIHEVETNHLLEGKCDYEDPSQPVHQSTPKW
jgi:hypothetical protein